MLILQIGKEVKKGNLELHIVQVYSFYYYCIN